MKISELLRQRPTLSFEIFPPKNKDGDISSIYSTIDQLAQLKPDFISVTYGAGGSTTRNTVEIATMIKERWQIESVAHLSCIDATAENLRGVLDQLKEKGIAGREAAEQYYRDWIYKVVRHYIADDWECTEGMDEIMNIVDEHIKQYFQESETK